jgi:hypothetical protein
VLFLQKDIPANAIHITMQVIIEILKKRPACKNQRSEKQKASLKEQEP